MSSLYKIIKNIAIPDKKEKRDKDSLVSRIKDKLEEIGINTENCLSQSLHIAIGIYLERVLNKYAQNNKQLKIICRKTNIKGKRQLDFYAKIKEKVFYFEFKTNISLDTEKIKATKAKIQEILLGKEHAKGGLVALRYLTSKTIPKKLFKRFNNEIKLFGLNDFLQEIGVPILTDEEYDECILLLVKRLKSKGY